MAPAVSPCAAGRPSRPTNPVTLTSGDTRRPPRMPPVTSPPAAGRSLAVTVTITSPQQKCERRGGGGAGAAGAAVEATVTARRRRVNPRLSGPGPPGRLTRTLTRTGRPGYHPEARMPGRCRSVPGLHASAAGPGRPTEGHGRDSVTVAAGGPGRRRGPAARAAPRLAPLPGPGATTTWISKPQSRVRPNDGDLIQVFILCHGLGLSCQCQCLLILASSISAGR